MNVVTNSDDFFSLSFVASSVYPKQERLSLSLSLTLNPSLGKKKKKSEFKSANSSESCPAHPVTLTFFSVTT